MKERNKKLIKRASVVAWFLELLYWANTAAYFCWLLGVWYYSPDWHSGLFAVTEGVLISFGYPIQDISTAVPIFVVAMVKGMLVSGLMSLIFHNIRRIFDVSTGVDWDSIAPTPFQPANVKLLRQVGFYAIAIPLVKFFSHWLAQIIHASEQIPEFNIITFFTTTIMFPHKLPIPSISLEEIFMGVAIFCLAQIFAYGVELQTDVDGLL